jgi:hypothetical protein
VSFDLNPRDPNENIGELHETLSSNHDPKEYLNQEVEMDMIRENRHHEKRDIKCELDPDPNTPIIRPMQYPEDVGSRTPQKQRSILKRGGSFSRIAKYFFIL